MPDDVYAKEESEKARQEAATVRARARGGTSGPEIATGESQQTSQNVAKQQDGAESSAEDVSTPSITDA